MDASKNNQGLCERATEIRLRGLENTDQPPRTRILLKFSSLVRACVLVCAPFITDTASMQSSAACLNWCECGTNDLIPSRESWTFLFFSLVFFFKAKQSLKRV